jgi:hypothetical protein
MGTPKASSPQQLSNSLVRRKSTPYKLDKEHKRFIIGRAAAFDSQQDIVDQLDETFHVRVSQQAICSYLRNSCVQRAIDACRVKYADKIFDIPIANKRVRLARLERLYNKAINGIEHPLLAKDGSAILNKDGKPMTIRICDHKLAIQAIKTAQEEIGEKEEKLAEAIRQMGGGVDSSTHNYYVNYVYGSLDDGQRERVDRESDAVLETLKNAGRFKSA